MIAQLEEEGAPSFKSFISSVVHAVTDVASAATNVATSAAHAVSDVATAACPAVQVAAQVCPAVAAAGAEITEKSALNSIKESGLESVLTLEQLKAIRQKNS
ncbi:hypothetical protein DI487_04245 [Flavobacterium sediminis]|uniref:Uncharacterized protein n=2 Tax=Flavobacteriaceae TaxID=49546 RepID=A0A2U8QSL5_9FLAO|nr:hypothetical protein DI487_04245 [Flavobacterium sediminis]